MDQTLKKNQVAVGIQAVESGEPSCNRISKKRGQRLCVNYRSSEEEAYAYQKEIEENGRQAVDNSRCQQKKTSITYP
jgi:hypothetical protein